MGNPLAVSEFNQAVGCDGPKLSAGALRNSSARRFRQNKFFYRIAVVHAHEICIGMRDENRSLRAEAGGETRGVGQPIGRFERAPTGSALREGGVRKKKKSQKQKFTGGARKGSALKSGFHLRFIGASGFVPEYFIGSAACAIKSTGVR
jgi:hypothetical protein